VRIIVSRRRVLAGGAELVDAAPGIRARRHDRQGKEPKASEIACQAGRSSTPTCTSPPLRADCGLVGSGRFASPTRRRNSRTTPAAARAMSEGRRRMAAQVGATYLQSRSAAWRVMAAFQAYSRAGVVLGAGVVGINAAYIAWAWWRT